MRRLKEALLWLFVINLGIAFGAGLYESRVVVPEWAGTPPETWPNTGLLFWVYVTTVPLTLLTIANAVAAWKTRGPRRGWYLAAVVVVIAERLATFSYFIPTMAGLMGAEGLSQAEVDAVLSQWMLMNHGRHLLSLTGWLMALKTLSIPGRGSYMQQETQTRSA
ncbi:DUF1772 domain-containing protein [Lihuaxuella thermophila]|uniref:DUF1772 domain-containing protein n=1 Tax=Lihuaxuella thermophila TaxID=1173111 RepID=A0A1H8AEM1_9BACL|nr:DUF1772 domain-containing protein [Lihuaxuella thermophila]SEM68288.1 protein of unknown function [Lihuaxuella thermophila]